MKTPMVVVASVACAAGLSLGVLFLVEPWRSEGGAPRGGSPEPELLRRVERLEERLEHLEGRLAGLEAKPARVAAESAADSRAEAGRSRPQAAAGAGAGRKPPASGVRGPKGAFTVEAAVARLRSRTTRWEDKTAYFSSLTPEQRKAVLAALEAAVKKNPQSADAHNTLGEAYVQMLMNSSIAEIMVYGPKAEKEFDRALELDDHHWDARFNKAMSLANQPEFLGRRPEAIRHLEILIEQQKTQVPQPKHAAPYLILGNLYAQQGNKAKARAIWSEGLKRFPDSKELRQKLGR